MSDLTDKYLTENLAEAGYVQELDVGMRNLLKDMLENIADLYKHLKKYKRDKDIRPFAHAAYSITQSHTKKFSDWKREAHILLGKMGVPGGP